MDNKPTNKLMGELVEAAQRIYEEIAKGLRSPVPPWSEADPADVMRCMDAAIANARAVMDVTGTAQLLKRRQGGPS